MGKSEIMLSILQVEVLPIFNSKGLSLDSENNLLTAIVPVWYYIGVMKYDYTIKTIYGTEESCDTLAEAKKRGKELIKERPDCDPVIDQYYKDDELTGEYWLWRNGKFAKPTTPPISLKGLIDR